jgi:large subunit ribosomal protein L6
MSRIGKKPIDLPAGASIQMEGLTAVVKGPKGSLRVPLPAGISLERKDGHVLLGRERDEQAALHGLSRSLVANAVKGVTDAFETHLDIVGIGYRAERKGEKVVLALGYSHPIEFSLPAGVDVAVDKQTHMVVKGADRQQVGQVAANLRGLRPPDPYKNKGIRYTGERLKKKVGKAAAGAGAAK